MAARISSDGTSLRSSTPEVLFNATPALLRSPFLEYDVTPDGQRSTMLGAVGGDGKHPRSDYHCKRRLGRRRRRGYLSLEDLPLRNLSHILILSWPSLNPAGQTDLP
jgi:hypothetical protein